MPIKLFIVLLINLMFIMQNAIAEHNYKNDFILEFENLDSKDKTINNFFAYLHKNLINRSGITFNAETYFGIAKGIYIDVIVFNDELVFYLAPSRGFKFDAGADISTGYVKTYNCKDLEHYRGDFFTYNFFFSGPPLFTLPFGFIAPEGGIEFSWGIDLNKFSTAYLELKNKYGFEANDIIDNILDNLPTTLAGLTAYSLFLRALQHVEGEKVIDDKIALTMDKELKVAYNAITDVPNAPEHILNTKNIRSNMLANINNSEINNFAKDLYAIFNESLSGCNAQALMIGANYSIIPFNKSFGFNTNHYILLKAFKLKDIKQFPSKVFTSLKNHIKKQWHKIQMLNSLNSGDEIFELMY